MKFFIKILPCYLIASLTFPINAFPQEANQKMFNRDLTSGSTKKLEHVIVPSLETPESEKNKFDSKVLRENLQIAPQDFLIQKMKIHILGDVESPGTHDLLISERLSDAFKLATPKRTSLRIVQIRHPGEKTEIYDLYRYYYFGDLSQNPYLEENDVIFVPKHQGLIRVEGPIAKPGLYELYHEKNIEDIIKLSGGLTTAASSIYPIKVIRFSEGGKKFVLDVPNTKKDRKNFEINKGDIIIVPDIINNPKNFDYKVETIPGEQHFYPTATPNVFVVGKVLQSGAYPYKSHLQVKDYVAYAAPESDANLKNVTLIRNGKRKRTEFNDTLQAGDIISVRGRPNYTKSVTILSTALSVVLTALLLDQTIRNR